MDSLKPLRKRTPEEIEEIVLGIITDQIFTSSHCKTPEEVKKSFVVLTMIDEIIRERLKADCGFLYQWRSKAFAVQEEGNRPIFLSTETLGRADAQLVWEMIGKKTNDGLKVYVIYEYPEDFPSDYVLREHTVFPRNLTASPHFHRARSLEEIRKFLPPGLHRIDRNPNDLLAIKESWL